jgi:hypothetical protein
MVISIIYFKRPLSLYLRLCFLRFLSTIVLVNEKAL